MTDLRLARPDELPVVVAIDDDAALLYLEAGLDIAHLLRPDHPFVLEEQERWAEAIRDERLFVACVDDVPIGFASLGTIDGEPYLGQLSVLRAYMQRGVGRALLERAIAWSHGRGALWLTTYGHLPFNRPFYERLGFDVIPEASCGPEIRDALSGERRALPAPEQRVAMRRRAG